MDTRITHFSLIYDFLDVDFNSTEISGLIKKELDDLIRKNFITSTNDWTLIFNATYSNARTILISKNKLGTSTKDKIKEIKIVIPIPTKDEIYWGVTHDKYLYKKDHYDNILNNFWTLTADCKPFDNRTNYIVDSLRKGINKSITEGISIGGQRLKIKTN